MPLLLLALSPGLFFTAWTRESRRVWIRAFAAVLLSAALVYALTTKPVSVALIGVSAVLVFGTHTLIRTGRAASWWGIVWMLFLVGVLVAAKLPQIGISVGISTGVWIGISFFIFRLLHMVFDARSGKYGDPTLPEAITYALHPASLIAGPIDRIQRNVKEQRERQDVPANYFTDGAWRILIGLFKKVAIANTLYAFLNVYNIPRNPDQPTLVVWVWLFAYGLYIYFDFAGYTDIALGVARWLKLRLPENFANPYAQPNIAKFWQAWHITLSNWLRDYVFFPMSRSLMKRTKNGAIVQFAAHLTTMLICGLWHGLTPGFAAWGVWHGIGLFVFGRMPKQPKIVFPKALSVACTVLFVMVGWVFFDAGFGLDISTSFRILLRLFGLG
jgi:alginate O-acetyltransferase complex protein AlgI